ncbi:hypothetical protein AZF37_04155 [endosymbiont 'TC1' of Trimyema compressum]|uniref:metal ABC transporter substrate-binding protein n=1 Tax=endosymbiont 'TC1' of Trimyema compressum TaxID=243899 RepID=UPI0007F0FD41|nr:metal ABC transporter substrate-binding protein [endosymbiont 'TC1' of Trimyema compressum]AMP20468.1 hypothetical protein AZF37_04155 [endosymbiont 'TC1' of Trimyema compressum]
MKKIIISVLIGLVLALGVVGCSGDSAEDKSKLSVVATLFPQYDFDKAIGGDKAEVTLLLSPGVESHSYKPTPGDILKINKSDLFIYTGAYMEPWAHRIIEGNKGKSIVVDASKGIPLEVSYEEVGHEDHSHDNHSFDPHIWLDLTLAAKMVDNIVDGFIERDSENEAYYRSNGEAYKKELSALDQEFKSAVEEGTKDTLVFGGRFAYQYFLDHYGLNYVTAYDSCSSEGEPSVKTISEIIKYINDNKINVIYYEEFVDPKIANSIAAETGVKPLLFTTAHNVTKDQFNSGISFMELMRENLANVKEGLK